MAKGSKWAKIKEQYPKLQLDGDYTSKIEAVLNASVPLGDLQTFGERFSSDLTEHFTETPLRALEFENVVRIYNHYRDEKERLENELSTLNLKLEAVEFKIEEHYEANDLLTQKFDDGSSITVAPDPVVSVSDARAFYAWLKEDPTRVAVFKLAEYVHPQTAKAGVKALLELNQPAPPGIDVFYQNKLTRRSG